MRCGGARVQLGFHLRQMEMSQVGKYIGRACITLTLESSLRD
jgi:hypothetical protein